MSNQTSDNNKRIAKNTLFLYFRSLIIMTISIYTSRVVLKALGIEDYGIYNIVGGFVGMFSMISSCLVNASQRFISFEMGKDKPQMQKVFGCTITIHLLLAFLLLIVFETFGLWFLNVKLNIMVSRLFAANVVYQCSIITFCCNILSIPFNASIVAHEKMSAFAYISIYEVVAKLLIVYVLWVIDADKLILYAILMLSVTFSLQAIYVLYCKVKFDECRSHSLLIDKEYFKSIISFTGWNFIGSTAAILVTQGINILINLFFGVALNAARGIAEQVNNAINQFIGNFMTALNPQITKSYAAGEYEYANLLMVKGAKYATLIFWLLSLPVYIKADYILDIWLVKVPPYAPIFLKLAIIYSIFQTLSNTLYIGMLATGNIKKYQMTMGILYIASFILCYVLFYLGLGPEWGYLSTIIALFIGVFVRLYLLGQMIPNFSITFYLKEALFKSISVIIISYFIISKITTLIGTNTFVSLILTIVESFTCVIILALLFALNCKERKMLKSQILKIKYKFKL